MQRAHADTTDSYSIEELAHESGFDRRTIAYYVQEGLLPRAGRRGPKTRYPREVLERLLFIRAVRDLQEREGVFTDRSLGDIRDVFESQPPERIRRLALDPRRTVLEKVFAYARRLRGADVLADELPARSVVPTEQREVHGPSRLDSASRRRERMGARRERRTADAPEPSTQEDEGFIRYSRRLGEPAAGKPLPPASELAELLARLGARTGEARAAAESDDTRAETWTRLQVSDDVVLSVHGLEERDLPLAERVARLLRQLIAA